MQAIIINHRGIEQDRSEINPKGLDLKIDTDQGHGRGEYHTLEIADDLIPGITKRATIKKKEDLPENKQALMIESLVCIIKLVI